MLLSLAACARERRFEFTRVAMGVEARVVVYARDGARAAEAAGVAYDRIEAIDLALSDYRAASEVSRLSAARAGERVAVSADFEACARRALEIARLSGGAYDPTVGPVVRLWREARRLGERPDEEALGQARALVDYRFVGVEGGRAWKVREGVTLDFGGIGKGYAAHQALLALRGAGHPRALVSLAGDVAAGDAPPGAAGWTIDVGSGRGAMRRVVVRGACVSTSGDTEQYIEIDGVRYSHIVDPRTGLGVTSRVAVTVIAERGEEADALASAVCVLGASSGMEFLARHFPAVRALVEWPEEVDGVEVLRRIVRDPRGELGGG